MVDGDIFREVESEIRRERYGALWDKFGFLVVGSAVAIVAAVAGYKIWNYRQAEQAKTYGTQFSQALSQAQDDKKKEEALASFQAIAESGPSGYAMLANLRVAAANAAAGKTKDAVGAYDNLAKGGAVDPLFQDFARIQAAMLRVDKANFAEMQERLSKLAQGESAWRHSARELLGLSAYKAGDMKSAEEYYNQIGSDPQAPRSMRQRVQIMLALVQEATVLTKAPKPAEKAAPAAAGTEPAKPAGDKK